MDGGVVVDEFSWVYVVFVVGVDEVREFCVEFGEDGVVDGMFDG